MARIRTKGFSCRGRKQRLPRSLQYLERQFASYRGKALQKFFQGVVTLEIFEESLHRHARTLEHRGATKNIRVNRNEIRAAHVGSVFQISPAVNLKTDWGSVLPHFPSPGFR